MNSLGHFQPGLYDVKTLKGRVCNVHVEYIIKSVGGLGHIHSCLVVLM